MFLKISHRSILSCKLLIPFQFARGSSFWSLFGATVADTVFTRLNVPTAYGPFSCFEPWIWLFVPHVVTSKTVTLGLEYHIVGSIHCPINKYCITFSLPHFLLQIPLLPILGTDVLPKKAFYLCLMYLQHLEVFCSYRNALGNLSFKLHQCPFISTMLLIWQPVQVHLCGLARIPPS